MYIRNKIEITNIKNFGYIILFFIIKFVFFLFYVIFSCCEYDTNIISFRFFLILLYFLIHYKNKWVILPFLSLFLFLSLFINIHLKISISIFESLIIIIVIIILKQIYDLII
jgi:hypothetical protein